MRGGGPPEIWRWSHEGLFYRHLEGQSVQCLICPNRCVLHPGDRSVCRSRVNHGGKLYSLAYGNPCAVHIDPVEKKPLYHFMPGSRVFSLATTGCNFRCLNCQNWEISQARPEDVRSQDLFPEAAVARATTANARAIAYTYAEAITFYEFMSDIARQARARGLANLLVSNGYINPEPLELLCDQLDGANINLKSFSNATYRKLNGGTLQPVLECLKTLHRRAVHFEITTLVVPGYVDDAIMIREMCAWIRETLGRDHPLHFNRFFPRYKLDRLPATPIATLERFRQIALEEGLHYVYIGNVPLHEANHTYCHACGRMLIERAGYHIPTYELRGDQCRFCDQKIPGIWSAGSAPP
jgi:pyruvate formate lyase activating enzyme